MGNYNYIKVTVSNGEASLFTPYNENYITRIRHIPGSKWDSTRKCWKIPENSLSDARQIMKGVYGYDDTSCLYQTITYDIEEAYDPYSVVPKKGSIFIKNHHALKCCEVHGDLENDDFVSCVVKCVDDTDEGKDLLVSRFKDSIYIRIRKHIAEIKNKLNNMDFAFKDYKNEGGYEWHSEWGPASNSEIIYEYISPGYSLHVYKNNDLLCYSKTLGTDPTYHFGSMPLSEGTGVINKIEELISEKARFDEFSTVLDEWDLEPENGTEFALFWTGFDDYSRTAPIDELINRLEHMMSSNCLEPTKIIHTKLVGVTFDDRPANIRRSNEGDSLELIREPDNTYDQNAIRVENAGSMLGYISKNMAAKLAQYMDDGNDVVGCRIDRITGGGDFHYGVNISIVVKDNGVFDGILTESDGI